MITNSTEIHVCRECGEKLGANEEFCAAHPGAIVDTILAQMSGVRCRIDSVGCSSVGNVDREFVADTLCWSPNADGVSRAWNVLLQGHAVEVASAQIPRQRFARGKVTTVTFFPLAGGEDGLSIPASSARVVRIGGAR